MTHDTDILIAGAGPAGLAAAAMFGTLGYRVVCVDPAPPVTDEKDAGADIRTTAILQPGRDTLSRAGIWERLGPQASPLQTMRIVDLDAAGEIARSHDFDAAEVSDEPFGWNLPNWLLRREMMARLSELGTVDFRAGLAVEGLTRRTSEALVRLSDGSSVRARLVIGADGRDSPVREASGIGARSFRYGQKALAFAVSHDLPHGGVSTEIHRSGGPFTLVPLPDRDGKPASAVVWMEKGPEALRLMALDEEGFNEVITERSGRLLGELRLISRRSVWPVISRLADRMSADRVALMAEAAHAIPPIGAQGLNMSLADLECLSNLAGPSGTTDPGDAALLDRYHRARHPEILARVLGVDALNRASMAGAPVLARLRGDVTAFLGGTRPVRRTLMKLGLGQGGVGQRLMDGGQRGAG